MSGKCHGSMDDAFYGTTTINERGQIVIPIEARNELGFGPGDKLMIMRHPVYKGIVAFKIDAAREFFAEVQESLNRIEEKSNKQ